MIFLIRITPDRSPERCDVIRVSRGRSAFHLDAIRITPDRSADRGQRDSGQHRPLCIRPRRDPDHALALSVAPPHDPVRPHLRARQAHAPAPKPAPPPRDSV
jgi:hypothetical protein